MERIFNILFYFKPNIVKNDLVLLVVVAIFINTKKNESRKMREMSVFEIFYIEVIVNKTYYFLLAFTFYFCKKVSKCGCKFSVLKIRTETSTLYRSTKKIVMNRNEPHFYHILLFQFFSPFHPYSQTIIPQLTWHNP